MSKSVFIIFMIAGLGAAAFFLFRARASSSIEPLDASEVMATTSLEKLQYLRNKKCSELAQLLEGITDASSARDHVRDAELLWLQIELITSRGKVLAPYPAVPFPFQNLPPEHDLMRLTAQCKRLAPSYNIIAVLTPRLNPLFLEMRVPTVEISTPSIFLAKQIQFTRSGLHLYSIQHASKLPDFATAGWTQLLNRTDAAGRLSDGPHSNTACLHLEPQNPFTNSSRIFIIDNSPLSDFRAPPAHGYVFYPALGKIWALNEDGSIFDDAAVAIR